MKTFRELYFRGTPKQLSDFVRHFREYAVGEWKAVERTDRWKDYLFIDYLGEAVDKARVSIYLGDNIEKGELQVGNIIPLEKNQLTVDEYNSVLMKFYKEVILPYKEGGSELTISHPSDESFDPLTVISKPALEKLKSFCALANKSTGSSHPNDQERWFDFICQTVDDDKIFDYTTLGRFLQDEVYWNKKPDDFNGVMGDYAWDEDQAYELASEYEQACILLRYYKKTRGL